MVVPQHGWFIMENLIKMDDLGLPPFKETPIYTVNFSNLTIFKCCGWKAVFTSIKGEYTPEN